MRIDRLLWFLRFAKSRSIARNMAKEGHLRINGRRVDKASLPVRTGDILTIPLGRTVRVVELLELPVRRGPAREAQSCYRMLDETGSFPIAAANRNELEEGDLQP